MSAVLLPFDGWTPLAGRPRLRRGGPGAVARALIRHADIWADTRLPGVAGLPIAVLPFQLAPALAILRGAASRVLIADEVGLGKTVQAGLLIAALTARGVGERVLIVVPAGLREQWRDELWARLRLRGAIVDAAALRERAARLPPTVGPWERPGLHVLSMEFARQLDVLAGLTAPCWDILVVDEAHHVCGHSARAAAVRSLAARARHVVLLTATPHDGDEAAFASLCGIGRLAPPCEDPLLLVRRTRQVLDRPPGRRTVLFRARETREEQALHHRLARYVAAVNAGGSAAARLAMLVLEKRALSGPAALAASARRRLSALAAPGWWQAALPLDDDGAYDDPDTRVPPVLGAPGGLPAARERAWLRDLIAAAELASQRPSKLRRLVRLLTRTREQVIVFTEYRDTQDALGVALARVAPLACLHGGMTAEERRDALDRFGRGAARVLLATDAAGEGLNLQASCRIVALYELPWTPARIEQRIGRVDRLGQQLRVHVWHLVGRRGEERRHLARLAARLRALQGSLVGSLAHLAPELAGESPPSNRVWQSHAPGVLPLVDLAEAHAECRAVRILRRLLARPHGALSHAGEGRRARHVPWARLRPKDRALAPGAVFLIATRIPGTSRERLLAVHVRLRTQVPAGQAAALAALQPLALDFARRQRFPDDDGFRQRLGGRERALQNALERLGADRWQPALFDRRATRAAAAAADRLHSQRQEHRRRLDRLDCREGEPARTVAALLFE